MQITKEAIDERYNDHNSCCKLVNDPAHWAEYGIHTMEQLDRYLDEQAYIDSYKDEYGIKPRWINWDEVSDDELTQMWATLCAVSREADEWDEEYAHGVHAMDADEYNDHVGYQYQNSAETHSLGDALKAAMAGGQ